MKVSLSLRRRLTWYVVITMLTLTTLSGIAIYRGTTKEATEIFNASLVHTAHILDGLISRDTLESSQRGLKLASGSAFDGHRYKRKLFFAVLDIDGSVLLHSPGAPEFPSAGVVPGFSEFNDKSRKWLVFALQSSQDDLVIVVGEHSIGREEITESVGKGLLLPLILLLPLVIWMLWHIVGVALRPLQIVTDQVREQDLQRLKPIDVSGVPREVSPLVDALNQMIVDLDAAYLRERRFVSDAAHELRNPLASLLINIDNAIEETQEEDALDSLQSMKVSIRRLSHLVSQLLALSHLEKGDPGTAFEPVNLARICAGAIVAAQAEADAKSIALELIAPDSGCELVGALPLLESLVTNLLENAISYADPGCRVVLQCQRRAQELVLTVDDSGPGLDAEQREKAPDRFYRAGDTNRAGAGLGLSIVKTIAQSHCASVELSESKLGGLCVTVRFDLA
ncbi:MAG: sensor histidine kinase N-terminal domain-containing protein [Gammaproteobacteria bacterium]|jgi:two-component system sensor histidine kinase QseC|nr:sensor histidine kinase N-terminal domain-containing protein [Gammaproteobacteria bacterium]